MKEIIKQILKEKLNNKPLNEASSFAPINIAFIKYWGKDKDFKGLNVPYTPSISVSIPNKGTKTTIKLSEKDEVFLNGKSLDENDKFVKKLFAYIDLFRKDNEKFTIITENQIATGAGLASSASGFGALVKALDKLYSWKLSDKELSILARLGSGSASRSVYDNGFVEIVKDGAYTYAKPIQHSLKSLFMGFVIANNKQKEISSRDGMNITSETSIFYKKCWKDIVELDIKNMKLALEEGDFAKVGKIAQQNCLNMHATMISAGVIYWNGKTIETIKKIQNLQEQNVDIFFTIDAGANVKVFSEELSVIDRYFPDIEIIKILHIITSDTNY